ncbi:MAG: hypothetical protein JWN23_2012 [Rhodocyclales bacterium]|nr:hypothetical protein [Rhodocyclales bacterium]
MQIYLNTLCFVNVKIFTQSSDHFIYFYHLNIRINI